MSKKDEPMTVCIVGVAGFIGSHMLEKIIRERDWHVIGADMVPPMKIQQLLGAEKKWCAALLFEPGAGLTAGALRGSEAAARAARGVGAQGGGEGSARPGMWMPRVARASLHLVRSPV